MRLVEMYFGSLVIFLEVNVRLSALTLVLEPN